MILLGFRGFNASYHPRDFGEPDIKLLPVKHQEIIHKNTLKFEDKVMRPSKHEKLKEDILIDNLFNKQKERGWRLVNSVQYKDFAHDKHSAFEFEIMTRTGFKKPEKH